MDSAEAFEKGIKGTQKPILVNQSPKSKIQKNPKKDLKYAQSLAK